MQSKTFLVLMTLVTFLFVPHARLMAGDKQQLKIPLPPLTPLLSSNQCRCESFVNTAVYANTLSDKNIVGTLSKGGDKISVEVEADTLYFLSGTSFEVGTAKPAEFEIRYNTDESLLAVCSQHTGLGLTVDVFTLNKQSGFAVWTKTRSYDILSGGHPLSYSMYLKCK